MLQYKANLIIYILWHQEYADGKVIADHLFSHLSRDIANPISRSLGIPVYFRNLADPGKLPIILNEAEHSAVVALIDDHMIGSAEWKDYLEDIEQQIDQASPHRLFPVSISEHAFKISTKLPEVNFIRLHEIKLLGIEPPDTGAEMSVCQNSSCNLLRTLLPGKIPSISNKHQSNNKCAELLTRLTHELCRMLQNRPRVSFTKHKYSPAPVSMFISHAKADGLDLAKRIKAYVDAILPLKTFFDANDIAPGYSFSDEIAAHGSNSALLVIKTDSYASREWCRKEILIAKEHDCPIVVVNAVHQREERSFPYMGNVPTIRIDWESLKGLPGESEAAIKCIIDAMLSGVLRSTYQKGHLQNIARLFMPNPTPVTHYLTRPPELLNLTFMGQPPVGTLVYPDPPLGDEELALISTIAPNIAMTTPVTIWSQI